MPTVLGTFVSMPTPNSGVHPAKTVVAVPTNAVVEPKMAANTATLVTARDCPSHVRALRNPRSFDTGTPALHPDSQVRQACPGLALVVRAMWHGSQVTNGPFGSVQLQPAHRLPALTHGRVRASGPVEGAVGVTNVPVDADPDIPSF